MLKNPFGYRNGEFVTAEEVASGLACGCTCPQCGAPLVAKHCVDKTDHFAHHNPEDDCGASYESAVHIMAKEILQETKQITIPYLDIESSRDIQQPGTFRCKKRLVERRRISFDHAELEVRMAGRIPDVVLSVGEKQLLVEIVVTHGIDAEKLEWIRTNNLDVIEVRMDWASPNDVKQQLRKCLLTGWSTVPHNIVWWAHHSKLAETRQELDAMYLKSLADGTVERPKPIVEPVPNVGRSAPSTRKQGSAQRFLFE